MAIFELNKNQQKNLLVFLSRVQTQGTEAYALVELMELLKTVEADNKKEVEKCQTG